MRIGCVLAALALGLTFGCSPRPAPEPLLLGHLAPLSGPQRLQGQHARQGVLLAITEALDAGAIPIGFAGGYRPGSALSSAGIPFTYGCHSRFLSIIPHFHHTIK